jgi:hypothetical protein
MLCQLSAVVVIGCAVVLLSIIVPSSLQLCCVAIVSFPSCNHHVVFVSKETTMMNDETVVVIHCLVAMSLAVMWLLFWCQKGDSGRECHRLPMKFHEFSICLRCQPCSP